MSPNPILTYLESLDSPRDVIAVLIYPPIVAVGDELSFVVCLANDTQLPPNSLGRIGLEQVVAWRDEAMSRINAFRRNGKR